MSPREILMAGAVELETALRPHGFSFRITDVGQSSGGDYASGEYWRDSRRLELHFRWSLGLVSYHVGGMSLPHEEYVRAVQAASGSVGTPAYPGFPKDPLESFRHLALDLDRHGRIFCSGTDGEFAALHNWVAEHPRATGFAALP